MSFVILALGVVFGFALSRSGAADYDFIQGMFLFDNLQLYGIIGTAVVITAPGLILLRKIGKTVTGQPIVIKPKTRHRGNVVGGLCFGVGWSITGMCPGPVIVNIGEGKLYAWAAFAGVLLGTWLVGALYPRLQPALGLAALPAAQGSSEG